MKSRQADEQRNTNVQLRHASYNLVYLTSKYIGENESAELY
ncbi:hypothetical protein C8R21_11221 [Nitrosospira multiformis]|uniref:Uncharacterized protein n=1 Tax=Nitrosospira multiformis TaxID=1231 RepID=A0A2T5IAX3_9PROT|nr:hypothetical protein C8R21_11221 [Nitrosospira multiformis]